MEVGDSGINKIINDVQEDVKQKEKVEEPSS